MDVVMYRGHKSGTGTNRYIRYNTDIVGANYQNNPNSPKQDNNSPKKDNPAHKLNPEKLETKPTNTYNQPTNNEVKGVTTG
jgi:hypothetical protein